jgi:hypothetical protein
MARVKRTSAAAAASAAATAAREAAAADPPPKGGEFEYLKNHPQWDDKVKNCPNGFHILLDGKNFLTCDPALPNPKVFCFRCSALKPPGTFEGHQDYCRKTRKNTDATWHPDHDFSLAKKDSTQNWSKFFQEYDPTTFLHQAKDGESYAVAKNKFYHIKRGEVVAWGIDAKCKNYKWLCIKCMNTYCPNRIYGHLDEHRSSKYACEHVDRIDAFANDLLRAKDNETDSSDSEEDEEAESEDAESKDADTKRDAEDAASSDDDDDRDKKPPARESRKSASDAMEKITRAAREEDSSEEEEVVNSEEAAKATVVEREEAPAAMVGPEAMVAPPAEDAHAEEEVPEAEKVSFEESEEVCEVEKEVEESDSGANEEISSGQGWEKRRERVMKRDGTSSF